MHMLNTHFNAINVYTWALFSYIVVSNVNGMCAEDLTTIRLLLFLVVGCCHLWGQSAEYRLAIIFHTERFRRGRLSASKKNVSHKK